MSIKQFFALVLISCLQLLLAFFNHVHASDNELNNASIFEVISSDNKISTNHDRNSSSSFNDEIDVLKKRLDLLEKAEKKRADELSKLKAESKDKWNVKLGGHVQMDYVNWVTNPEVIDNANDYFEFRRLRLVAEGTGYDVYDFRLQMTLEPETVGESPAGTVTSPDVKDAYFSINKVPCLGRIRIGNFFVPFGLEQVTNDTNNIFMERSIPTQGIFSADREVGIATYNSTEDQYFTWSTGFFLDSISEGLKERIDDNQGYRVTGRLTWLPFYDEASKGRYLVHTGLGILYTNDQDERVRLRARPQIHEGPRLIDTGSFNANEYTTLNLESAIVNGPVALQSEVFVSFINMKNKESEQVNGAYTHISYFLTGENRLFEKFGQHGAQFGRNSPKTKVNFTSNDFGLGAWEMKARVSYLNLDNLQAGTYYDVTAGFNWYWSDRVRIMFDLIHPITSAQTPFGSTQSNIAASRFDFNW